MKQKKCLKFFRGPILASLSLCSVLVGMLPGNAEARHHVSRHHRAANSGGHVIQCVAFAKTASDVALSGNAADWWYNARGVYARGQTPEPGSVLNFRAIRRMPLGHVAVVTQVESSRSVIIDQSHWAQRGISRNVRVIDVSPNNDWSAVRVALNNRDGSYGSIYPTYGFIYGRPDDGTMVASRAPVRAQLHYASAEIGARSRHVVSDEFATLRHPMASTEVAEAPDEALPLDAPNRSIR